MIDEPICRAAVKNQIMEQTYGHGVEGRKVKVEGRERVTWKHMHYHR